MANYYSWVSPNPVVADSTQIKSGHMHNLCDNMNLIRGYITDFKSTTSTTSGKKLGDNPYDYGFTDDPVTADVTKARDDHMNDLRDALDNINSEWATYTSWSWCRQYSNAASAGTGNRVTADLHRVRAVHVNELRSQLDLVDSSMYGVSPFCGTNCQTTCQTSCQASCQMSCQGCNNSTCHNQMCGFW